MCIIAAAPVAAAAASSGAAAAGTAAAAGAAASAAAATSATTLLSYASIGASILGAGVSFLGSQQQAAASRKSGEFNAAVQRNNQVIAQRNADDARKRGEEERDEQQRKTAQLIGRQRALMANNNIDLGVGTPIDIVGDTAALGKIEELRIKQNAEREAYGFEVAGMNYGADAQLSQFKGESGAQAATTSGYGSLLTGFGGVAEKWYKMDGYGTGKKVA